MMAERSHPDRFGRGTLWVAVEGSAWAQELRMIKDKILERLDEAAGEQGLFTDVRFGVRALPPRAEMSVETVEPVVEKPALGGNPRDSNT